MPSGDFQDLAQQACRSAQLDPADLTGDYLQAQKKVNEAYLSCCHTGDPWVFLEREGQWTTSANADVYSYASIGTAMSVSGATIREITHLVLDGTDGGTVLQSMDWPSLEELTASTQETAEGTGCPWAWGKWDGDIRLYPKPDRIYTLGTFCYLTPNEMSANTDVPLIPLAWRHRVIVPLAAALLLEQEGGSESFAGYDRAMSRYSSAFQEMRTSLATAQQPTFNAVEPALAAQWGHRPGGVW